MRNLGLVPNVITYSALISACETGQKAVRALELFHVMRGQGLVLNVITYTALISACEKGKELNRALMPCGDATLSSGAGHGSYNAVISAWGIVRSCFRL